MLKLYMVTIPCSLFLSTQARSSSNSHSWVWNIAGLYKLTTYTTHPPWSWRWRQFPPNISNTAHVCVVPASMNRINILLFIILLPTSNLNLRTCFSGRATTENCADTLPVTAHCQSSEGQASKNDYTKNASAIKNWCISRTITNLMVQWSKFLK